MLKCVIVGCKSSTETGVKFIKFPLSDSPAYEHWMKLCYLSADIIRVHPEPYICANHFSDNSDLVNENSVPSLYLNPIHDLAGKVSAILTAQQRRTYLMDLVDAAVLEWSMRARHHPALAPVCKLRSGITPIARKVLNIVDPTLQFSFDDSWWTKFQSMQMVHIESCNINDSSNKTLNLVNIIHELDPSIGIKSLNEDVVLVGKAESNNTDSSKSVEDVVSNDESQDTDVNDIKECSKSVKDDESNVKNQATNVSDEDQEEPNIKPELTIESYSHALEYIKTLEDFALQQEDYRAIGMLSSLKYILQTREDSQ